jgi:hypothetical protein
LRFVASISTGGGLDFSGGSSVAAALGLIARLSDATGLGFSTRWLADVVGPGGDSVNGSGGSFVGSALGFLANLSGATGLGFSIGSSAGAVGSGGGWSVVISRLGFFAALSVAGRSDFSTVGLDDSTSLCAPGARPGFDLVDVPGDSSGGNGSAFFAFWSTWGGSSSFLEGRGGFVRLSAGAVVSRGELDSSAGVSSSGGQGYTNVGSLDTTVAEVWQCFRPEVRKAT